MSRTLLGTRSSAPPMAGLSPPSNDPFDHDLFNWSPLHPDNRAILDALMRLPPRILQEPAEEDGETRCVGICVFSRQKDLQETPSAEELEGKSAEEIDEMLIGRGWARTPSDDHGGSIYRNPDRGNEQVRVMPNGTPNTSTPELYDKPYGQVSRNARKTRFFLR